MDLLISTNFDLFCTILTPPTYFHQSLFLLFCICYISPKSASLVQWCRIEIYKIGDERGRGLWWAGGCCWLDTRGQGVDFRLRLHWNLHEIDILVINGQKRITCKTKIGYIVDLRWSSNENVEWHGLEIVWRVDWGGRGGRGIREGVRDKRGNQTREEVFVVVAFVGVLCCRWGCIGCLCSYSCLLCP